MDIAPWLTPICAERPCGTNLEYEPAFTALFAALNPDQRQDFSSTPSSHSHHVVDWAPIFRQSSALLQQSKDLRLAVLWLRSAIHLHGAEGLSSGLQLLSAWLAHDWDGCFPLLDPDDDCDPTWRLNILSEINATDTVLSDIRAIALDIPAAGFTWGDLSMMVAGADDAQWHALDLGLRSHAHACEQLHEKISSILAHVHQLVDTVCQQTKVSNVLEVNHLEQLLTSVQRNLKQYFSDKPDAIPDSPVQQQTFVTTNAIVRNRDDVKNALRMLCDYLQHHEPTHPVQLLLYRAQKMLDMNFLQLLEEFAPDGYSQALQVLGHGVHVTHDV